MSNNANIKSKESSNDGSNNCPFICAPRKEEYSPLNLVIELIFVIPAFIIGSYGLFWVNEYGQFLAIFYLIFSFGCYFVLFRIVLCPNCYYYGRWCPDGMGKFAKKVYRVKGDVNNYKRALVIPTIGWATIVVFPTITLFFYFFINPNAVVPLIIGAYIVQTPVLIYDAIFAYVFMLYFTVHQKFSCKGCAHIGHCNLSKVPLHLLFLGIIAFLITLQIIYVIF